MDQVADLLRDVRARGEAALCDRAVRYAALACLRALGVRDADEAAARRLLTVLYISHDDRALRRPAFAGDAPPERIEDLAETAFDDGGEALAAAAAEFARRPSAAQFRIACALMQTWRARSRALAAEWVLDAIAMARLRGEEPARSLMHQARQLGVEREALSRWRLRRVAEEEAVEAATDAVRRAFWDRVREEDPAALWGLAGELRDMMLRLLFCAPRHRAEVEARFDVDLLRQQAEAALSAGTAGAMADFAGALRASILYVTETVAAMVCAADQRETRRWADAVRAQLDANPDMPTYLRTGMVDWLRACFNAMERVAAQIAAVATPGRRHSA